VSAIVINIALGIKQAAARLNTVELEESVLIWHSRNLLKWNHRNYVKFNLVVWLSVGKCVLGPSFLIKSCVASHDP